MFALPATTAPPVGSGDGFACEFASCDWVIANTKIGSAIFGIDAKVIFPKKFFSKFVLLKTH